MTAWRSAEAEMFPSRTKLSPTINLDY
jgi:hypothetical protein